MKTNAYGKIPDQDGLSNKSFLLSNNTAALRPISEKTEKESDTEEKLRKSEERFRLISETLPIGVFEVDSNGQCIYTNTRWQKIFGMTLEESLTTHLSLWFHPEDRETVWKDWSGAMECHVSFSKECRILRRKGDVRWVFFRSSPVFIDSGIRYTGTVEDITERKTMEKAVGESEEKFRDLFDNAPIGYHELDREGRLTNVNCTELEMLGYTREEMIGRFIWDFASEAEREESHRAILGKLDGTIPPSKGVERTYRKKDGTVFPALIHDQLLIQIENGRIIGVRSTFQDITERKRAELALKQSEALTKRLSYENAVIAEIGRIIGSTLNIEEVYSRFAEEVRKLISFDQITINLVNLQEKTHTIAYVLGKEVPVRKVGDVFPLSGSATGAVAKTRSGFILQTEDRKKIESEFPVFLPVFESGFRSTLVVPLFSKDQVIGVLNLRSFKSKSYTERGLRLAERVANHIAGAIANAHLFAERRQAEQALSKNQEELLHKHEELNLLYHKIDENRKALQLALDHISSLIDQVIRKKSSNIKFANPSLKECYKIKNCNDSRCYCYEKGALKCWETVGMYASSKALWTIGPKHRDCSKCLVYVQSTSDPIYQINEQFSKMMRLLESKNSDLREANRELKITQAKILQQEKMASIGQLAAGVAHEINNPIAFVSSNLGTLEKYVNRLTEFITTQSEMIESLQIAEASDQLKEKRAQLKLDYIAGDIKELIKESLEGSDRVRKIVQGLKTFARVDEAEYKYADINECIESTINIVWNELKYKAVLKKDFGEIPLIKCYPQQLNQVFMNLLVNGAHAIEKQGEITVKTWKDGESIFVAVSDTGCGIPKENLSKIFEPFFTTKEMGKGTGLGLSIAYDIIKRHHGEITVQSKMGKGTTFILKIPIGE